jgi:transcriptional regulator with XRE-family HTH domain
MKPTWWYSSTDEQKLIQINAAYELEMTTTQLAMNFGISRSMLNRYFKNHDISWEKTRHLCGTLNRARGSIQAQTEKKIKKYQEIDNTALDEAFTLFENTGNKFKMNYLENYQ